MTANAILREPVTAVAPPTFDREPKAHRIASDAEAIDVARALARDFAVDAAERDRTRRLPAAELDRFSGSGLWAITVPQQYGGAGVSCGGGSRRTDARPPGSFPDGFHR